MKMIFAELYGKRLEVKHFDDPALISISHSYREGIFVHQENKGFCHTFNTSAWIRRRQRVEAHYSAENKRKWLRAELQGTDDPYLKWHDHHHCLMGLIFSISFYFSICFGAALSDMYTPALRVYLRPRQVLNRLMLWAICAHVAHNPLSVSETTVTLPL